MIKSFWLTRGPDRTDWVNVFRTQPRRNKWGEWTARSDLATSFCYETFYRATGMVIRPGECFEVYLRVGNFPLNVDGR